EPAISAAISVGAKANNSSGSFFIFYSPFRSLTVNNLSQRQTKSGRALRRSVRVADDISIVRRRFPGGAAPPRFKRRACLNSSDILNRRFLHAQSQQSALAPETLVREREELIPIVRGDFVFAGAAVVTDRVHDRLMERRHLAGVQSLL